MPNEPVGVLVIGAGASGAAFSWSIADAGMSEMELRDRFGWSPNSSMPYRYTRATLRERTIERSRRLAPGNSIKI